MYLEKSKVGRYGLCEGTENQYSVSLNFFDFWFIPF